MEIRVFYALKQISADERMPASYSYAGKNLASDIEQMSEDTEKQEILLQYIEKKIAKQQ